MEKNNVTFFFPVYNDEKTVRIMVEKATKLLKEYANEYEIIIINDNSPDDSGKIADEIASNDAHVKVIHHKTNLGYGSALQSGFKNAKYNIICFTDGDDEYEVYDFAKLFLLVDYYDLIITFRYVKLYSNFRIFISWIYNIFFRLLFKTNYRDISTGLRLVKKDVIDKIFIQSSSPFIGAELTVKLMLKGYRIGEVGIQTFPRAFNKGASVTFKNIMATIKDMVLVYKTVFSKDYDLPVERQRIL